MSRIGNQPIQLPKGVDVKVDGRTVTVKGGKGQLTHDLRDGVDANVADGAVTVSLASPEAKAMYGTTRAILANMVEGVANGFTRKLEIQGVGYRAQLQGKKLVLNVGFCHTVEIEAPTGIDFNCPDQTHIEVSGIDKQLVGQVAANIRAVRKKD